MKDLHISTGSPAPLARQVLSARLYNPNGGLRHLLEEVADGYQKNATISVLSDSHRHLFGVALLTAEKQISVYVNPKARGHGWGRKLVELAKVAHPDQSGSLYALPSDNVAKGLRFWERCGIEVKDHGELPYLNAEERKRYRSRGSVLVVRDFGSVTTEVYETLYLQKPYEEGYTDEHAGIRGKLACIFNENLAPFDWILFHLGEEYESCALLTERKYDNGEEVLPIVEIQMFVKEPYRRQGRGQEIIDAAKRLYPNQTLYGYHTPTASGLNERNGIVDLGTDLVDV